MAAQEAEITLRNGRVEFRVFIYRESPEEATRVEPVGTIEGMVDAETSRLIEMAYTDALSAHTDRVFPVAAVKS